MTLFDRRKELFNLPKRQAQSNMFVKYVLHSLMGTHIILGFRYKGQDDTAGQEELDKSFAVHFSDDERLVMHFERLFAMRAGLERGGMDGGRQRTPDAGPIRVSEKGMFIRARSIPSR